jgi:hypothetical protein
MDVGRPEGPNLVVARDRFTVRFLHGGEGDLDAVQDVDAYVTVPAGPTYYVSLFTLDAIAQVMQRWAHTGEAGNGSYFWTTDLVIVPRPGLTAMITAIEELVDSGDIDQACQKIPAPERHHDSGPAEA